MARKISKHLAPMKITRPILAASIALLLAAPARGAEAAEPGEGILMLRTKQGNGDEECLQALLISTDVVFQISGPVARARLVQTFNNPAGVWCEGLYVFPLPQNAAVDRLLLRVGERVTESVVHERAGNVFAASFANIGPRETVVVELEYQQPIDHAGNRFSPRFPMLVAPRHVRIGPL